MLSANDQLSIVEVTFGITIWARLSDFKETILTFGALPIPYKSSTVAVCAFLSAIIPESIFADGTFRHISNRSQISRIREVESPSYRRFGSLYTYFFSMHLAPLSPFRGTGLSWKLVFGVLT
jgi:hypothetical protein